jgi:hypothetical protein
MMGGGGFVGLVGMGKDVLDELGTIAVPVKELPDVEGSARGTFALMAKKFLSDGVPSVARTLRRCLAPPMCSVQFASPPCPKGMVLLQGPQYRSFYTEKLVGEADKKILIHASLDAIIKNCGAAQMEVDLLLAGI